LSPSDFIYAQKNPYSIIACKTGCESAVHIPLPKKLAFEFIQI